MQVQISRSVKSPSKVFNQLFLGEISEGLSHRNGVTGVNNAEIKTAQFLTFHFHSYMGMRTIKWWYCIHKDIVSHPAMLARNCSILKTFPW